jgi:hypothetical protein
MTEIEGRARRLKVKDYYKHFVSIYGALSAAIASFPLLSKLLPEGQAAYLFPPLGDQEPAFRAAALILGALVTLAIYFSKDMAAGLTGRGRVVLFLTILAPSLAGLLGFFVLSQSFVRTVPVPGMETEVVVSVGYERTPYAQTKFPAGATDWELLRGRGLTEEEVQRLWTSGSVIKARLGLYISYMLFLLPAVAAGSVGVLLDKLGGPAAPEPPQSPKPDVPVTRP